MLPKKKKISFLLGNFLSLLGCFVKVFHGPTLSACPPLIPGFCDTSVDCYSK